MGHEMFVQVHEGLPSYHLMVEGRHDLVDRIWYNADRAFTKDVLKDTQNIST